MKYFIALIVIMMQSFHAANSQNLAAKFDSIATANDIMGAAVVVFCESHIIDSYYVGKSDYQRDFNVNLNTKFRIASISKTITSIAVMQLVEQNLLSLDSDIGTVLGYTVENPNYPTVDITARMLLSHTSSIIDGSTYSSFLGSTVNDNPIPNLSELLTPTGSFYDAGQFNNTVPGTYFNYSNVNFVILGTIVEKVSGLRFDVYCRQHIFEPLGLDASFNVNDLQNINSVAVLYRKIDGLWTPQADNYEGIQPVFSNLAGYVPGTNGGRFGPQGGLRCSALDLATILMCFNNPGFCPVALLNPVNRAAMLDENWTYSGSNGNNYYGLFMSWGLGIHRVTSTPGNDLVLPGSASMFGHTGEAYGLVSDAYFDTTRKAGFVFITNGVGTGYQTNSNSAFYTVEQEVFNAIENYANLQSCYGLGTDSELTNQASITIYPNPVSNTIKIKRNCPAKSSSLKIYGVDGKLVMLSEIASQESEIDVSDLECGIYFLHIDARQMRIVKF